MTHLELEYAITFREMLPITNKENMLQSISGIYDIPKTLSKSKMKSKWVKKLFWNIFEMSVSSQMPFLGVLEGVTKYQQEELPQNQSWIPIWKHIPTSHQHSPLVIRPLQIDLGEPQKQLEQKLWFMVLPLW